jgi:glyoxylase-like metal-dependent hydrolase (beta-lactamase superfamily II)
MSRIFKEPHMDVYAFTTGTVKITASWRNNSGSSAVRLIRSLTDSQFTEPLPIWCYLIDHPEGLILIDTGILTDANKPIWFPPYMRLLQRAAQFQIKDQSEDIGAQLQANGFSPQDVRWVILTHLHQDHDGGLNYFPNAEFLVSRAELNAAQGLSGRLAGYQNTKWPTYFTPKPVDFNQTDPIFGTRYTVTQAQDVYLVPTIGHSPGHMSVVVQEETQALFFGGDTAYSQELLLADAIDGVGASAEDQRLTHRRIMSFARQHPMVYLPSHEWNAQQRLAQREVIPMTGS